MAITLVGSASSSAINGGDVTVTLPGGTQEDDLVLVCGISSDVFQSGGDSTITTSGYTELFDVKVGNVADTVGAYKIMGASPDSNVTMSSSGGSSLDAASTVVFVFRGVDQTTPIDQTTVTDSGADGSQPNSPSITTQTNGAAVVSFGSTFSGESEGTVTAPSGYGDLVDQFASDAVNVQAALSWDEIATAGAEDPGAYSGFSSDGSDDPDISATMALRPDTGGGGIAVPVFYHHYKQMMTA